MEKLVRYTARLLAMGGIAFLALFALDVFQPGIPWHQIAIGLFMHLIPNYVLIAILIIAWRIEWLGGLLFIVAGLLPLVLLSNPIWVNLVLGGPFIVSGALFLFSDWYRRRNAS